MEGRGWRFQITSKTSEFDDNVNDERRASPKRSSSRTRKHSSDEEHRHYRHERSRHGRHHSPRRSHHRHRSRSRSADRRRRSEVRRSRSRDRQSNYHRSPSHSQTRYPESSNSSQSTKTQEENPASAEVDVAPPFTNTKLPAEVTKLKQEIEKRKLLWNKKEKKPEECTSSPWQQTAFSDDRDGKVSAKFKRLMGIKDGEDNASNQATATTTSNPERSAYFENLEKQYEVARATTHTQRGVGLGFQANKFMYK